MPLVFILVGLAIVTSVAALLMLLSSSRGDTVNHQQMALLQDRMRQLEERMDKYEAIDEKVTRIWEQAKSFEKFKDRFDRSEASMSLRMDHLTMSLEALQKQLSSARQASASSPSNAAAKGEDRPSAKATGKTQYHIVSAGDTFFNISKRYDLEVEDLLKMNDLKEDSVLKIGQKIIVHKGKGN